MPNNTRPNRYNDAAQSECDAYNLAFCELGLDWFWDAETYAELQAEQQAEQRVHSYIARHRPHLLRAYDAGFLAQAIETTRARSVRAGA